MKLATWNVNSLKVRLSQVINWLESNEPDILCLQETKLLDENFPIDEILAAGYCSAYTGQKTYNGVALLSKRTGDRVVTALPGFEDVQKRIIAATFGEDIRVVCVYVPNGDKVASEKYHYKLAWLAALEHWLREELINYPKLVVLGDFNIAPEDRDVHDPDAWRGKILCSQPERDALHRLLGLGLVDSFRLFDQPEKTFTWWDYRMMAFRRNRGLRIDYILLSSSLAHSCLVCKVDKTVRKNERPSDHAPVVTELVQ